MNRNSLYIVATPIGNREDITLRAIEVLKSVDAIAAEDTRHSLPLLQHYGISKPMIALHDHNERQKIDQILSRIQQGQSVAYISDAGTPLISDPGYHLVKAAREQGVSVVPIPGVSALITALSVAGLPTDKFVFDGFLPVKNQARLTRLRELLYESRTMIFYEAPHRILDLLASMQEVFGLQRKIVIARELTKVFETIHSGTIEDIIQWMQKDPNQQRGEMVVLVAGADVSLEEMSAISSDVVLKLLLAELPVKKAAEIAAKITGKRKNDLYDRALILRDA